MQQPSIGFIGAGNMATALIQGMLAKSYPSDRLIACDPSAEQLERLQKSTAPDNICIVQESSAASGCDILVLAVKPQILPKVAKDLSEVIATDALVVSVAAGITLELLQGYLDGRAVVRAMPNTPALVSEGATGLYASSNTSESQKSAVTGIFETVGLVQWLGAESDLDLVTAVSGSGPAYFFLFMEAMIESAVTMGLDRDKAHRLCVQTCRGAAVLAAKDPEVAELRKRVTSPNGTTEKAVATFEAGGLRDLINTAMQDCADRSREMAREASEK